MSWHVYNKQALWRHRRTARSESSLHLGQKMTLISPCSEKLRESTMFALVLFSTLIKRPEMQRKSRRLAHPLMELMKAIEVRAEGWRGGNLPKHTWTRPPRCHRNCPCTRGGVRRRTRRAVRRSPGRRTRCHIRHGRKCCGRFLGDSHAALPWFFDGILPGSSSQTTVCCAHGCTSGCNRLSGRAPHHRHIPPNARDRRIPSSCARGIPPRRCPANGPSAFLQVGVHSRAGVFCWTRH